MVGIPSGRSFPFALGIQTRRTGSAWQFLSLSVFASSPATFSRLSRPTVRMSDHPRPVLHHWLGTIGKRGPGHQPGTVCRTVDKSGIEGLPSLSHEVPSVASRLLGELPGSSPISSPRATSSTAHRPRALSSAGITQHHWYYGPIRHPDRAGVVLSAHQFGTTLLFHPVRVSRVTCIPLIQTCCRHYPGGIIECVYRSTSPATAAFPECQAGRLPHYPFRGLLSVHCSLRPVCSPSPIRTIYTGSFSHFVTSITVPIATGWNDTYRVGVSPTEERRLFTAH